ncbi:hypothetical protein ACVWZX_000436 [Deinococcus sp. UYEF24]
MPEIDQLGVDQYPVGRSTGRTYTLGSVMTIIVMVAPIYVT